MKAPVDSARTYLNTWLALLFLLFLTWAAAQFNLGRFNAVASLTIAVVKMLLVILFFMQVRHSSKLTWLFVAAGFVWFLIMVDLTLSDYLTREVGMGWPKP